MGTCGRAPVLMPAPVVVLPYASRCSGLGWLNIQPAQPGRLHEQNKLPSTAQLKAEHGVSTTVVRQAILVLQTQGWVEGVHGLGVFVADRSESR